MAPVKGVKAVQVSLTTSSTVDVCVLSPHPASQANGGDVLYVHYAGSER